MARTFTRLCCRIHSKTEVSGILMAGDFLTVGDTQDKKFESNNKNMNVVIRPCHLSNEEFKNELLDNG